MIPPTIDGRTTLAFAPIYTFVDRQDAVVITEWDDPTPYVVRPITIIKNQVIRGSGEYYTNRSDALKAFKDML